MRVAFVAAAAVLLASAGSAADAEVVLPIPDRDQDPKAPPSGWCGETAIQEALLHFGVWAPQKIINRAGKPKHPDLYSNEIPTALTGMGIRFTTYKPQTKGFAAYSAWVADAIDHGDPVFVGVKILPTEHPDWGLDHFVLAVGHGNKGLLVNTTWNRRQWADDKVKKGLSFANAFYAIRLHAPEKHARLSVLEEGAENVKLSVWCPERPVRVVTVAREGISRFSCATEP
jgi:hypothetical protein